MRAIAGQDGRWGSGNISEVYVKLTLPDPPPIDVIRAYARTLVRTASAAEKRQALSRMRALQAYVRAIEQELGTVGVEKIAEAEMPKD